MDNELFPRKNTTFLGTICGSVAIDDARTCDVKGRWLVYKI